VVERPSVPIEQSVAVGDSIWDGGSASLTPAVGRPLGFLDLRPHHAQSAAKHLLRYDGTVILAQATPYAACR
jgi:hypothetical protein